MPSPLLEPAVLVSENCSECGGTGYLIGGRKVTDTATRQRIMADLEAERPVSPVRDAPCQNCETTGRVLREVPLSEFVQMLDNAIVVRSARLAAPGGGDAK